MVSEYATAAIRYMRFAEQPSPAVLFTGNFPPIKPREKRRLRQADELEHAEINYCRAVRRKFDVYVEVLVTKKLLGRIEDLTPFVDENTILALEEVAKQFQVEF